MLDILGENMIHVDINQFKQAWYKWLAKQSTVLVFNTLDPWRLPAFIHFVNRMFQQIRIAPEIYLYRVGSGLFRVIVEDGKIRYEPVVMRLSTASTPLAQAIAATGAARIVELCQALAYLNNVMEQKQGVVAIFWGLFSYGNVSQQELYGFIKFLRDKVFNYEYYQRHHMIAIFSEYPQAIIDDETMKYVISVNIPPSTDEERKSIIAKALAAKGINDKQLIEQLVIATKGLNLHETESVIMEALLTGNLSPSAVAQYKNEYVKKSGIVDIEEPQHGFEAVGGYDVVKEFVRDNIVKVLKNPEKAERLGLRPPRGILLFGPPGTGKTWFARALAKELGIPFLRLRTEKIVSKWYGETSRNIAKAIEIAEAVAPCVLFIDEIDRFGRRGHLTEHEESRRAFSILLEWLGDERRKTIVIGTTNRPQDLDEAFVRVGRFDYIIPMLYPDYHARLEILRVHTSVVRKVPLAPDVDLAEIARRTELWTGAELKELVVRAARLAFREDSDVVTMRHFEEALKTFRINYDERQRQLQHYLELAQQYTNDVRFLEQLLQQYSTREMSKEMITSRMG